MDNITFCESQLIMIANVSTGMLLFLLRGDAVSVELIFLFYRLIIVIRSVGQLCCLGLAQSLLSHTEK